MRLQRALDNGLIVRVSVPARSKTRGRWGGGERSWKKRSEEKPETIWLQRYLCYDRGRRLLWFWFLTWNANCVTYKSISENMKRRKIKSWGFNPSGGRCIISALWVITSSPLTAVIKLIVWTELGTSLEHWVTGEGSACVGLSAGQNFDMWHGGCDGSKCDVGVPQSDSLVWLRQLWDTAPLPGTACELKLQECNWGSYILSLWM